MLLLGRCYVMVFKVNPGLFLLNLSVNEFVLY